MIVAIIVLALIALGVVAAVAWPLIGPAANGLAEPSAADPARMALDDEIAASLQAIKDLQFDHAAGNIDDDDFADLDRAERANAARLIRRRNHLDSGS